MKLALVLGALFFGMVQGADLCPDEKETECITDCNHGKNELNQLWKYAIKQLEKKEKINKPILTVLNISLL